MKPSKLALSAGVVALMASSGFAQQNQDQKQNQNDQKQAGRIVGRVQTAAIATGKPFLAAKASELIGKNIENEQGKEVGDVNDLLLDLHQGRVAGIVVGVGGILGVGEKPRIVPPQAIRYRAGEHNMVLSMDDKLRMSKTTREDLKSYHQLGQIYSDYQQSPYWEKDSQTRQAVRDTDTTRDKQNVRDKDNTRQKDMKMGEFQLKQAKELIGANIKNKANKTVGEVDDFIIDLNSGRVIYATVSAGGFLGVGDRIVAIPPRQFEMNSDGKLTLDTTEERLKNSPQFEKSQWPNLDDPAWVSKVYGYYGEKLYWAPDSNNQQPVRENEQKP